MIFNLLKKKVRVIERMGIYAPILPNSLLRLSLDSEVDLNPLPRMFLSDISIFKN